MPLRCRRWRAYAALISFSMLVDDVAALFMMTLCRRGYGRYEMPQMLPPEALWRRRAMCC